MSDEAVIALFIAIPVTAFIAGGLLADLSFKRKKPKSNIRVPRSTLWERTNQYHRSNQ